MSQLRATACASLFVLVCLGAASVRAESITPIKIVYHQTERENSQAKTCWLTAIASIPSAGETLIASAIAAWDKSAKVFITAINLGVLGNTAEPKDDHNGNNGEPSFISLASAGFSAAQFNSAGLFQVKSDDNSVWIFIPAESRLAFMEAFLAGEFRLIVLPTKSETVRTYEIKEGPSDFLQERFTSCAAALVPKEPSPPPPSASTRENQELRALERAPTTYGAVTNGSSEGIMRSAPPAAER